MARLLAGCCMLLWSLQAAAAEAPTVLRDDAACLDAQPLARSWADPRGDANLEQVVRAADSLFAPAAPDAAPRLPPGGAYWLHLRLQKSAGDRQDWLLKFPMPLIDRVTVYQLAKGEWRAETAGDTLAVNRWPERGRYPVFRLELPQGEVRDVFVRIEHGTPANFPVQLETASSHAERVQLEYLALGLAFGALMLLIASCLALSWAYRDADFAWYAGYAALTTLAVASYTGVAGQFLWPGFGMLGDAPTPMLACAAVGAAVLFVRQALGLRQRLPALDRLTLAVGLGSLALFPLPALTSKPFHIPVVGGFLCLASLCTLLVAAVACWRGDVVARWVLAAQFPLVTALVVGVSRALGWAVVPYFSQYAVVSSMAIEVPLMLVALFIRSRDRHGAEVREQALSTHDALTGLLAPHLFTDRLRQVVGRYRRHEENAAIMVIDLVNHAQIRQYYGSAAAEQSLLRSVIKLRRLVRDVDTVSRLGETRFAVLLEGVAERELVTERCTRLIAAGLMPLPGLRPDVTLQFHIAALLLADRPMEAEEIERVLSEQLARMSPRTRRPIRFIQSDRLGSLPGDSSSFPDGSTPPAVDSRYAASAP